jgi:hypothetical protein
VGARPATVASDEQEQSRGVAELIRVAHDLEPAVQGGLLVLRLRSRSVFCRRATEALSVTAAASDRPLRDTTRAVAVLA